MWSAVAVPYSYLEVLLFPLQVFVKLEAKKILVQAQHQERLLQDYWQAAHQQLPATTSGPTGHAASSLLLQDLQGPPLQPPTSRSSRSTSRSSHSLRPVEGSARPVEDFVCPVEGSVRPVEGMFCPVEGSARPVEGPVRPVEGHVCTVEGFAPPVKGFARPVEGSVRPVEGSARPVEGSCRPVEGSLCPVEGFLRPVEGFLRPVEGRVRPVEGLSRPGEGYVRPVEGSSPTIGFTSIPVPGRVAAKAAAVASSCGGHLEADTAPSVALTLGRGGSSNSRKQRLPQHEIFDPQHAQQQHSSSSSFDNHDMNAFLSETQPGTGNAAQISQQHQSGAALLGSTTRHQLLRRPPKFPRTSGACKSPQHIEAAVCTELNSLEQHEQRPAASGSFTMPLFSTDQTLPLSPTRTADQIPARALTLTSVPSWVPPGLQSAGAFQTFMRVVDDTSGAVPNGPQIVQTALRSMGSFSRATRDGPEGATQPAPKCATGATRNSPAHQDDIRPDAAQQKAPVVGPEQDSAMQDVQASSDSGNHVNNGPRRNIIKPSRLRHTPDAKVRCLLFIWPT